MSDRPFVEDESQPRPTALGICVSLLVFLVLLWRVPLTQLDWLRLMPGDIGDARLNNLFLENIYRVVTTGRGSLWEPGFFAPMPYVIGLSDNLFGAAPIYIAARLADAHTDTAYQLWFLSGYAANFGACWYALRRLGCSTLAAAAGAAIFTFALPTSAHVGHAQLHHRFGVPLAIAYLALFFVERRVAHLASCCLWTVWQFYCGVYNGFFLSLVLAAMTVCWLGYGVASGRLREAFRDMASDWGQSASSSRAFVIAALLFSVVALALLFFPYLQVSRLYAIKRSWGEIAEGVPRRVSFVLADASAIWGPLLKLDFAGRLRPEHQMFAGAIPIILAAAGLWRIAAARNAQAFALIVLPSLLIVALTIMIGQRSLWYYLHGLPLFSAIRVLTRLDQIYLFPLAWLAAIATDWRARLPRALALILAAAVAVLAGVEMSATRINASPKQEWRDRDAAMAARLPDPIRPGSIVFVAQASEGYSTPELDAMWWAMRRGMPTLNGYSGSIPPGFSPFYGTDCAEMPRRAMVYARLMDARAPEPHYRSLMARLVPLGFAGCEPGWAERVPALAR